MTMHAKIYPGAIQRRYSGVSGIAQPTVSKLVLHSTETPGGRSPAYSGGLTAPTLTVCPWTRQTWQHFDANESAKALVDPSSTSVRENRDHVAQIEIVGYSDLNHAARYGYNLRELPARGIAYVADRIRWYHDEWEVPLVAATPWPMYPASYGATSARMSGPEYDRFAGVLGHLHVPGNSHGDPSIPIAKIMAAAGSTGGGSAPRPAPGPTTTTEEDDDMTVRDVLDGREKLNKTIPAQQWTPVPLCAGSDLWGWEEDNLVRIVGEAALPVPEGTVLRFFAVDKDLTRVKTWPESEGQTRQISTKLWGHHQLGLEVWSPTPITVGWTKFELVVFENKEKTQ